MHLIASRAETPQLISLLKTLFLTVLCDVDKLGGGGLGAFELYVAAFRLNDRFANQRKNSKWDRAVTTWLQPPSPLKFCFGCGLHKD